MFMPELVSGVDDGGALRHPGVVDENIYVANSLKHPRDTLRVGYVAYQRDCFVTDLTCDLFDLFGSPRGNGDTDTFACEGECDRATNPAAAACNQSCFSH